MILSVYYLGYDIEGELARVAEFVHRHPAFIEKFIAHTNTSAHGNTAQGRLPVV